VTFAQQLRRGGAVAWAILLALAFVGTVALITLGPLLVLAALVLLALAWRVPHRVTPHLGHRWLARVPQWMRASPMRFASVVLALTLPFAGASYALNQPAAALVTPPVGEVAAAVTEAATASPRETRTSRPTPEPRATPRSTPRPTAAPTSSPEPTAAGGEVAVHFLDVGQGSAVLIVAPDATMLIDTGRHDRSEVVPMLHLLGVASIDVVAITHGHADHIGQLDRVLGSFDVGEVWMSGTPHTTQTFDRAITAIENSTAGYEEPRAGDTTAVGSLTIEILNPIALSGDIDADMLVMRVSYGLVSFLFTGDLEGAGEAGVVARYGDGLASTVYQVAHHGSNSSSSSALLAAVQPDVAVYSASATNQYGHPHVEVIERLTSAGADIYGTAVHGTVTVSTDGVTYEVSTGQPTELIAPIVPVPPPATPAPTPVPAAPPPASGCQPGQVDINSAGFDALQLIIHIGPVRAQEMLAIRPFSSVNAMDRINGIGPARLADIKAQGVACVP
jgi:beta-lactamase superfamily II metal-dependent hydrolase